MKDPTDPNDRLERERDDEPPTDVTEAPAPRNEIAPHEPPEPILQFFTYGHLPEHLQAISAGFTVLAHELMLRLPRNAERSVALRKLLESKDAAVRAAIAR